VLVLQTVPHVVLAPVPLKTAVLVVVHVVLADPALDPVELAKIAMLDNTVPVFWHWIRRTI